MKWSDSPNNDAYNIWIKLFSIFINCASCAVVRIRKLEFQRNYLQKIASTAVLYNEQSTQKQHEKALLAPVQEVINPLFTTAKLFSKSIISMWELRFMIKHIVRIKAIIMITHFLDKSLYWCTSQRNQFKCNIPR